MYSIESYRIVFRGRAMHVTPAVRSLKKAVKCNQSVNNRKRKKTKQLIFINLKITLNFDLHRNPHRFFCNDDEFVEQLDHQRERSGNVVCDNAKGT